MRAMDEDRLGSPAIGRRQDARDDLSHLVAQAVGSPSGPTYRITDAFDHVPDKGGLYAIFGDGRARRELGVAADQDGPLYVGKAEHSLASRDLRTHFSTGKTGSSTVRRSFAALLREPLQLRAVPRNLSRPERFANFGLDVDGDDRLTAWMHQRLTLAVWVTPVITMPLKEIEAAVIGHWDPPLNLTQVTQVLPALRHGRQTMAAQARQWANQHGFDA
jgi:hypothetical protein